MIVRVLPKALAEKIAAGEVVERPASVVKELIENALDAGAKKINISVKGGGVGEIKVVDDGVGMSNSDLMLIPKRFTTSKLYTEKDLERISTFGFRGEALASICAVSKVIAASRKRGKSGGWMIKCEGGNIIEKEKVVMEPGTIVIVKDLFYNTPARRKFLKSKLSETRAVMDTILLYLLACPDVKFKVVVDDKIVLNVERETIKDRIKNVLSESWVTNPLEIFYSKDGITVSGFSAKPEEVKSFRTQQYFFVNNRPIQSKLIKQAFSLAYESTNKRGTPGCVLMINVPFEQVDVNVHPRKAEIRFKDNETVFKTVLLGVKKALDSLKGDIWGAWGTVKEEVLRYGEKKKKAKDALVFTQELIRVSRSPSISTEYAKQSKEQSEESFSWNKNYPVFQIADAYIVTQDEESIVVIDQHAAAERILYEKILDQIKKGKVEQQILAVPVDIDLKARIGDKSVFKRLLGLGIYAEPFGEKTIRVRAFPAGINQKDVKSLVLELLQEDIVLNSFSSLEKLAAIMACHHSIRFGEKLTEIDARRIVYDLSRCKHPFSCPHGRPTVYKISFKKLESIFER